MLLREYAGYPMDLRDGVKVILPAGWFLVRGSNTEPIIRVIAEAGGEAEARDIVADVFQRVQDCINSCRSGAINVPSGPLIESQARCSINRRRSKTIISSPPTCRCKRP